MSKFDNFSVVHLTGGRGMARYIDPDTKILLPNNTTVTWEELGTLLGELLDVRRTKRNK